MNRLLFLAALIITLSGLKTFSQIDLPIENPKDRIDSLINEMELMPIMINGDKDNRISIVLMNRWTGREQEPYNSPEMKQEFLDDIDHSIIAALTPGGEHAHTAFANYYKFFNVYGLWYPDSPEWGKGIDAETVDAIRDRLFLPWENDYTGWVTFLVMPNRNSGGGGAARNLEDRIGRALIAGNERHTMLHEIGHTCISIGDEYAGWQSGTSARATNSVALEYTRDKIKWRKWIDPETPLPTPYSIEYREKIGAFEGAQYHMTHYFRSTAQGCFMGAGVFDNTPNLCPICEQRLAMRVHTLVNPINDFTPSDNNLNINGKKELHFTVDYITPVPNTYVVRWMLNGKTIATGTNEIDVDLGSLENYELICSITDETDFIRPDPPFAEYPSREVKWVIENDNPQSEADDLEMVVDLKKKRGEYTLIPKISGGVPPYTFLWSDGSVDMIKEDVTPGIYELTIWDNEFRMEETTYNFLHSSAESDNKKQKSGNVVNIEMDITADITASMKGRDNGKIRLNSKEGSGKHTFAWIDLKKNYDTPQLYEAEYAYIDIPGHKITKYFNAQNNQFVDFNAKEGAITWNVEVAREGVYPVDIIFGGIEREGPKMKVVVNGEVIDQTPEFYMTRPQKIGWEASTVYADLKEGNNRITLASTGESGVAVDYIRIPGYYSTETVYSNTIINLKPGNYTVEVADNEGHSTQKTFTIDEVYPFSIDQLDMELTDAGKIGVADPVEGYTYLWYRNDVPLYSPEKDDPPIAEGTKFAPPSPGNYYVAAKNNLTHGESENRIGFAVDQKPEEEIDTEDNFSRELYRGIKFWIDASDIDGDWRQDVDLPARGPYREWSSKLPRNGKNKIFTLYEPNRLNGLSVGAFDQIWISRLEEEICDVQTIVMVYKESSMTLPGKSPFVQLNSYIGRSTDLSKRLFDPENTHEKTKNGNVYLNGKKVDPFSTPNPMEFCTLTIEFDSKIDDCLRVFEGNFEGEIAEMLIFDRPLTDDQRKGIEEYLRKKWFARFDLEF